MIDFEKLLFSLKYEVPKAALIDILEDNFSSACSVLDGPLKGVPFAVQNNICVEGARLTCGSGALSAYVSPFSAKAVKLLEDAGAIPVCTTNLDEFGIDCAGSNSAYGIPQNPLKDGMLPGCCSGAAVLVASGIVPFSLASDAGGGLRISAACCGVIGMKPSKGTYSKYGLAACAPSLEEIGIICRDIPLLRKVHACLSSGENHPSGVYTRFGNEKIVLKDSALKIALVNGRKAEGTGNAADIPGNVVEILTNEGLTVNRVQPPFDGLAAAYYALYAAEISSSLAKISPLFHAGSKPDIDWHSGYRAIRSQLSKEVRKKIAMGAYVLQKENYRKYYLKALTYKKKIKAWFDELFQEYGLLISPVWRTGHALTIESWHDNFDECGINALTACANLAGLPAISIPCGINPDGTPLAVQCIAPYGKDYILFDAAEMLMNDKRSS